MKQKFLELAQVALTKPQVLGVSAVLAGLMDMYFISLFTLLIMIVFDSILGGLATHKEDPKEFDWEYLFKKMGIKILTYAIGLAAALILIYYPFDGQKNEIFGWGFRSIAWFFIVVEYLSVARNGKRNGITLAPPILLKQLKLAKKTGRFSDTKSTQ
jgi:hypothetical protein